MTTFIVIVHIIVSIAMILVILLQTGKGSDIGAIFGGSSQTLFGASGPTNFLSKMTAGAAILFMITSLFLAYFAGSGASKSLMRVTPPASTAPAPAPEAPAVP
jgi:preprotein translocase subunit SecG